MTEQTAEQKRTRAREHREFDASKNSSIPRPPSGWGPALWVASGMYIAADLRNHEPLRTMIHGDTVKTVIVGLAVLAVFIVYLALRESEFRSWKSKRPPRSEEAAVAVALSEDTLEKNLCDAKLNGQDLRGINLNGARCIRIGLEGANLTGAQLTDCDMRGGRLRRVNFSECDLTNCDLRGADLRGANFTGASLQFANFHDAQIGDANFANASFGCTILTNIDLSQARGLDTIQHQYPSTLGVDTLHQSQARLSDLFLRGIGVLESLPQHFQSLITNPGAQPQCLISYSSGDQAFAERLHSDLRSKGIRCWFAPKDLPIGDHIRARLEKSLHECDKVVLVLSRHSIASTWVAREVETILERERSERSRRVLLPITLDDTFVNSDAAWAADIRRLRHVGDFTQWNEQVSYQAALSRILRDLAGEISRTSGQPSTTDPSPGMPVTTL